MRVLVTGATGFLGGALTRLLLAEGRAVIALARDGAKLARLAAAGAEPLACDLRAAPRTPGLACDAVIHCAALSAPWGRLRDFHTANVEGTRAALAIARAARARRFVHISTPSLYFRFRDQLNVPEDAPLPAPVNAYARTKGEAESLVFAARDLDPIILRPRGLYGPGDNALLPRLLGAARRHALPLMNGGRAATDLTFVGDAAEAARAALAAPANNLKQRVFNISGSVALNVREVAERAGARAGVVIKWRARPALAVLSYARMLETACAALPHRPEPFITAYGAALFAYTQTLDISAAKAQLGWAPRTCFEEGLERTFAQTHS